MRRRLILRSTAHAHRELALKIARESMVLLKNDGVLPLKAGDKEDSGGRTAGGIRRMCCMETMRHRVRMRPPRWKEFASSFRAPKSPSLRERISSGWRRSFRLRRCHTPDGKPGLKARIFLRRFHRRAAE